MLPGGDEEERKMHRATLLYVLRDEELGENGGMKADGVDGDDDPSVGPDSTRWRKRWEWGWWRGSRAGVDLFCHCVYFSSFNIVVYEKEGEIKRERKKNS